MTLHHDDETVEVTHAVASGKARVAMAKLAAEADAMDDKTMKLTEAVIRNGGGEGAEVIKALLESEAVTIEEVIAMNQPDAAKMEAELAILYKMFRVAVDEKPLTTEWKTRIQSDDFLSTQDVQEVTAFVAAFRGKVGV